MTGGVRRPAVAGTFYAGEREALLRELAWCYTHPLGPGDLPPMTALPPLEHPVGLIAPHAGYRYSGPVAAWAYAFLARQGRPQGVVLLGPDHYGAGAPLSLSDADAWETPLGLAPIVHTLDAPLCRRLPSLRLAPAAHRHEHSLEVHLPFLQHLFGPEVPLLPIAMGDQSPATAVRLGQALGDLLPRQGWALVASTDLSHYYPDEEARRLDRRVLEAIRTGRPEAVGEAAQEVNLCGPGPVMALLACCAVWGYPPPRLLAYATSGDTRGEREGVVGYASLAVTRGAPPSGASEGVGSRPLARR
jgi:AmmeMemoRadiSam system protein B